MCGRCRVTLRADDVPRACYLDGRPSRSVNTNLYRPSHNVSPGSYLPVIRRDDGAGCQGPQGTVTQCMKWGLIPSFTKKTEKPDHYRMFNARSESIYEKASFRRLIPSSRCLVAAEGFYEWKKNGAKKQPYYIHLKDGRPLVFAALYDSWKNSEGEILYTFTILTTSSSSALEWLHDRLPVILGNKVSTEAWLDGSASSKFDSLLKPYEEPDLVWYPVTSAIGKPSYDGPECIKEIQLKTEEMKPISMFFVKKGTKSNDESISQDINTSKKLSEADQPTSLKEEPDTEKRMDHQPPTRKMDDDLKPNVSTSVIEGATSFHVKRDYNEFSADTKPYVDEINTLHTSPVKKKGNLNSAGDKQPTMFSYFAKS